MGKQSWNQPAPMLPDQGAKSAAVMEVTPEETAEGTTVMEAPAEDIAAESSKQLEDQGWCTWRCEGLGGDVIVVIISELITNYPRDYPVYTLQELRDILPLDDLMLQAAHRAKKELGAQISQ